MLEPIVLSRVFRTIWARLLLQYMMTPFLGDGGGPSFICSNEYPIGAWAPVSVYTRSPSSVETRIASTSPPRMASKVSCTPKGFLPALLSGRRIPCRRTSIVIECRNPMFPISMISFLSSLTIRHDSRPTTTFCLFDMSPTSFLSGNGRFLIKVGATMTCSLLARSGC